MGQETEPILITTGATASLSEGMRSEISIRKFQNLVMDEPAALGGTDEGPNPMEYVMGALNGCVAVMIRLIAGEQNFRFDRVEFEANGVLDLRGLMGTADVTRHFQQVDFTVKVYTRESEERLEELKQAVHRRCPAINLLVDAGVKLNANWVAIA